MKKINFHYISVLLTGMAMACTMTSCDDWFDVQSKTEIKEEKLFSNISGYTAAEKGVYSLMAGKSLYAGELTMSFLDVLAQYYSFSGNEAFYYYAQHYDYAQNNCKSVTEGIWGKMYKAIVNADNILDHLDRNDGVLTPVMHSVMKGEMLGTRAMLHFDLLRMFAPAYPEGSDKPAIPYVNTVSRTPFPQLTTGKVMELIEKDCNDALACLQDYDPMSPTVKDTHLTQEEREFLTYRNEHMNWQAVKALQCRIAIWKGDYSTAKSIASALIDMQKRIVSSNIFALYNDKLSTFSEDYFAPRQSTSLELSMEKMIDVFEIMKYGTNDSRSRTFVSPYPNTTSYFVSRWYKTNVLPSVDMPVITTAEMYHTLAECLHREGKDEDAITLLNELRANYGLEAFALKAGTCDVMEEITKDVRKHMIGLGQMFYFYKRLGIDPIPGAPESFTKDAYVLPLPDGEMEFGSLIE